MSPLYRKRPITIEARRLGDYSAEALAGWSGGTVITSPGVPDAVIVPTLDGKMMAAEGDYIVRSVRGDYAPMRADAFLLKYQEVIGP